MPEEAFPDDEPQRSSRHAAATGASITGLPANPRVGRAGTEDPYVDEPSVDEASVEPSSDAVPSGGSPPISKPRSPSKPRAEAAAPGRRPATPRATSAAKAARVDDAKTAPGAPKPRPTPRASPAKRSPAKPRAKKPESPAVTPPAHPGPPPPLPTDLYPGLIIPPRPPLPSVTSRQADPVVSAPDILPVDADAAAPADGSVREVAPDGDTIVEDVVLEDDHTEPPAAEEVPVERAVVEPTAVEEVPVEDAVAERTVVEDAITDDAVVEEEDAPGAASIVDDAVVEEVILAIASDDGSRSDVDTGTPALALRGVVKSFGETRAVDGIDLTIPAGTFYGLVGPNGAGKTTTLSMIAGLLRPDRGSIVVNGVDSAADPLGAKRMMGVLPDRLRTFDRLTGRQLLYYYGVLRGLKPAVVESRTADLARAFDLTDALGRVVSDYSAGMVKKVMLAGAMIHSPRVLVLDEPFEAVDPVSSAVILEILGAYVAHGGTVLLSSHGMELVERVCSRVGVLVAGQVLSEGTIDEVRGELTLEQRFIELAGGLSDVEGLEWLHTFSD